MLTSSPFRFEYFLLSRSSALALLLKLVAHGFRVYDNRALARWANRRIDLPSCMRRAGILLAHHRFTVPEVVCTLCFLFVTLRFPASGTHLFFLSASSEHRTADLCHVSARSSCGNVCIDTARAGGVFDTPQGAGLSAANQHEIDGNVSKSAPVLIVTWPSSSGFGRGNFRASNC